MGLLINGQVGWRSATVINPSQSSTLWTSVYGVWNADTLGTSLDSSIFAAYNAESNANDSVGTNNGTAQGSLVYSTGKIGDAFQFNGTNAYVSLPDNSLNLTGSFAISVWVYPTSGLPQSILNNLAYTNGSVYKGWQLDINNLSGAQSAKITFTIGQGPASTSYTGWEFTTTAMTLNAWNHVVISRTSGVETYCWVNGISQSYTLRGTGANITTNPTYHTTQYCTIGASKQLSGAVSNYLKSGTKVDLVNIWNKSLTDNDVVSLYNLGNGTAYPYSSQTLPSPKDAYGSNNGTLTNGATFTTGKIGQAFLFDGVNDYITLPNNTLNLTGDFSISFWYNSAVTGAEKYIISNYNSNTSGGNINGTGFILSQFTDNTIGISIYNAGFVTLKSLATISANTWHHVVITRKSSTRTRVYMNGSLSNSNTSTTNTTYPQATYQSALGQSPGFGGYVNGKLDAVSVWNKELSQTEITELYNSGTGKQYPN